MGIGPKLESPQGHSAWDYAETFNVRLANIEQAIKNGQGSDPIERRLPFNFTTDAGGAGQVSLEIPRGVNLDIVGIGYMASAQGVIAVYVNEVSPFTLLWALDSALIGSEDLSDLNVTSDDRTIVIATTGQTASQAVTGNLRVRQYESGNQPVNI